MNPIKTQYVVRAIASSFMILLIACAHSRPSTQSSKIATNDPALSIRTDLFKIVDGDEVLVGTYPRMDSKDWAIPADGSWFVRPADPDLNEQTLRTFVHRAGELGVMGISLRELERLLAGNLPITTSDLDSFARDSVLEEVSLAYTKIDDLAINALLASASSGQTRNRRRSPFTANTDQAPSTRHQDFARSAAR